VPKMSGFLAALLLFFVHGVSTRALVVPKVISPGELDSMLYSPKLARETSHNTVPTTPASRPSPTVTPASVYHPNLAVTTSAYHRNLVTPRTVDWGRMKTTHTYPLAATKTTPPAYHPGTTVPPVYHRRTAAPPVYNLRTTAPPVYRPGTTAAPSYRPGTTAAPAYRRSTTTVPAYQPRIPTALAYQPRTPSILGNPDQICLDLISKEYRFSVFFNAVKSAGLMRILGGRGPLTIFAPVNEAFDKLPASMWSQLLADGPYGGLPNMLRKHVVPLKKFKELDAGPLTLLTTETADGDTAFLTVAKTKEKTVVSSSRNNANFVASDIECAGGIIHAIDFIL